MKQKILSKLEQVLTTQYYGVFNTIRDDTPHSTLVSFAATPDFSRLIFFSHEQTRKSINTKIHDQVSLFMDTRQNIPDDLSNTITLSAYGTIAKVEDNQIEKLKNLYLRKNPHMNFFIRPGVEMIVIEVDHYDMVYNFQTVIQTQGKRDNIEIRVRQVQGTSLLKGHIRAPVYKLSDDFDELRDYILFVDGDQFPRLKSSPKGIITTIEPGEEFTKNFDGPLVLIDEDDYKIESGSHLTIDGYLGIIIFHQIK